MVNKSAQLSAALCVLAALALSLNQAHAGDQENDAQAKTYAYSSKGIVEFQRAGEHWKLLLDESNLGGKELEIAELILPAGKVVGGHHHGTLEVFYVLSGTLGHEVNGEMHMLTPGMVGMVRPEDSVRHIVPKEADVKVLVIWAPAGEASKFFDHARSTTAKQ